ncbi:MAG: electron transport complex subunit RsxC [Candidatus Omnitrophica bacterium]|nr:electron transport complex subunit RsxC [Candidatus Omnitrophota bacterium]MCM8777137.1 electron transport complex subunit RsxC [Candidatus Omnitrophota bacterium]
MDYTKYRIKAEKEVREVISNINNLCIIWCKKCFSEFKEEPADECGKVVEVARELNIEIIECRGIDFLCNNHLTGKVLKNFKDNIPLAVISCGIGIQFVSNFFNGNRKVLALADSLPQSGNATSIVGYHGIALGEEKCAACGQCYLEKTGGICPVVSCAKSLLNGPCGGANKDGKCEVNKELPCAWIEIYKRLEKQKKLMDKNIDIRNYNIFSVEEKVRYVKNNQERRKEGFYGGLYPLEKKELTETIPLKIFDPPDVFSVFLSQHTGRPAKLIVKAGDRVKKGQKIGEPDGFISSAVHSPVSGKVIAIEERIHPVSRIPQVAITIENDGTEILDGSVESLTDWDKLPKERLIEILKEKGIVGLGGAMFPSSVKLCPPKPVDTLIVNGCECEPYLNADNRLIIEHPEEILKGIEIVRYLLEVSNIIFAIEDNKKEAIEVIRRCSENYPALKLETPRTKYPQGAERMLIKRTTGRDVPEGGLPFDVGCVVFNVGTLYSIYRAIYEGMPVIERPVTVAGENAIAAGNYIIRIGTHFSDILDTCFGIKSLPSQYELRMGGPMMGVLQKDVNSSVIKGTTGLLLLEKYPVGVSEENTCIRCGRCVDACPMELIPYYYAYYGQKCLWNEMVKYKVKNCIECGCCQYICSSKIDLISLIKKGKRNADNKT